MSGAYTVTGAGQGAAYNQKGPGNGRNFFTPQVTPHVVMAGVHDHGGPGTDTINLPPMAGPAASYMVMVSSAVTGQTSMFVDNETDTNGVMTSFDITTVGAGGLVNWMLVKTGQGLEVTEGANAV